VIPQGFSTGSCAKEDSAGRRPRRRRTFHDVGYVDYNVDKARNNYATMLYANGLQAERPARGSERSSTSATLRLHPGRPGSDLTDDEGRALLARKQQIESALARRP
jgi:hypothetical protein